MSVLVLYSLCLGLYLICAAATISYPKLPPIGNPGLVAAEKIQDQWVIGHSMAVICVSIYAITHIENYHVNLETMAMCSAVIHGFLFRFAKQLSKKFWGAFIFGFDILLGLYGIFLAKLH